MQPKLKLLRGGPSRRLVYVVNNDHFFLSHRLPLAVRAQTLGWSVKLIARNNGYADRIRSHGIEFREVPQPDGLLRVLRPMLWVWTLLSEYVLRRPDLVHHVTIRPVLIGGLLARLLRLPAVNALSGLGYAFMGERPSLQQRFARVVLRLINGNPRGCILLQNRDDAAELRDVEHGRRAFEIIRGSGVDLRRFTPLPEPSGRMTAILPARILRDKGVIEFVEAARLLRAEGVNFTCVLVGAPDAQNPTAIAESEIRKWQREGVIEWWGQVPDIRTALAKCHMVVLPSYREGLSKVLLEAAASARAMVTTDVPGCRDVVINEQTGLLVPARDAAALAAAMKRLCEDSALRRRLGHTARTHCERHFALDIVVAQTMAIYDRVSGAGQNDVPAPMVKHA